MYFTTSAVDDGIIERSFTCDDVPGVLWSPTSGPDDAPAPLLLAGHPGGMHIRVPGFVARARNWARSGFHVAAINAPGHGGRPKTAQDTEWTESFQRERRAGRPYVGILAEFNESLAQRAVPEWRAMLDAVAALPEVADGPVGYAGMNVAMSIGVPLAVADSRITAATFGGGFAYDFLVDAAAQVTIPIEFLSPLDDEEITRDEQLRLFDAFGSEEKVMLAFPGSHRKVPADGRLDTGFFDRHLRKVEVI
ncbi:alpha/beta hydrolase [Gordonia sp. TBRC 11910]|uniref:Alpha/beta hydrolase n=1 Tax=Gordonia asplenii TaxID=2725283 RepID=A0A848KV21_9ACTN|nr:alpha/beta hydrolase [Gordonia asplenii]NMO02112.1 alpha/beta hydrolase [Gordonia asplenii]